MDKLTYDKSQIEQALQTLANQIEQATAGKEESDERTDLLAEMSSLESKRDSINAQLDIYREMDPDLFEEKSKHLS